MKIDQASQISTKKGDKGTSKNYSSETFDKNELVFEALGTMDELSSNLGVCFHHSHEETIKVIQRTLQDINSIIATSQEKTPEQYQRLTLITHQDVDFLQAETQRFLDVNPLELRFVLPGSEATPHNAYFDIARTVARRAERMLVRFQRDSQRDDLDICMMYLNRLSDLLFVMARNYPNPFDK
jgi:cob(I)alamin adenosyltransferase